MKVGIFTCHTMQHCGKHNVRWIVCHVKLDHTVFGPHSVAINISVEFPTQNLSKQEISKFENDIVYNEEKTKCMCVKPSVMKDLYVPTFHLGHLNIKAVEKETYL